MTIYSVAPKELVHADDNLTDLVDAHLDLVSAAHGSGHRAGCAAGATDTKTELAPVVPC